MSRRASRPRRQISPRAVPAIRLAGWRYSATREAWVHRLAEGRVGPVFCVTPDSDLITSIPDTTLFDALVARREPRIVPEADRAPLPRRTTANDRPIVEVSLGEGEPPRPVVVDGRPPRRGIDPARLRTPGRPDGRHAGRRATA